MWRITCTGLKFDLGHFPQDKKHIKMTMNNIIMLLIVTDAQGFMAVKKILFKRLKQHPNNSPYIVSDVVTSLWI